MSDGQLLREQDPGRATERVLDPAAAPGHRRVGVGEHKSFQPPLSAGCLKICPSTA